VKQCRKKNKKIQNKKKTIIAQYSAILPKKKTKKTKKSKMKKKT